MSNASYLVETSWLQQHLGDPGLRVLDCTVFLQPAGGRSIQVSGRPDWKQRHIPGAGFADLLVELADRSSVLSVMMPPAAQFAAAMSCYGVGDDRRVVVYDAGSHTWASRLWWMLRSSGFDNVAVLNGGLAKWTAEQRPVESGTPPAPPPAHFTAVLQPGRFVGKQQVLAAIDDPYTLLINALSADEYTGKVTRSARAGHIPGSVSVPAASLLDPATRGYVDLEQLRQRFAAVGALDRERVITYCGGGVSACSDALALTRLGVRNVAVYDGSMSEWAADAALPLVIGDQA